MRFGIGPGDSSTAVWRLTPKPGVAGTAAGGKAFYARVTVAITIEGHTKVVSTKWSAPFQVQPTPELIIRYGVPAMGNLEIVAVAGNTTAVVGGSLPINLGPPGSVLGGLPA